MHFTRIGLVVCLAVVLGESSVGLHPGNPIKIPPKKVALFNLGAGASAWGQGVAFEAGSIRKEQR